MIRPATKDECLGIASRLREADRSEIAASSGLDPHVSLSRAWEGSDEVMAWVLNGEVEAISGTIQLEPGVAFPWLVGSDAVFGSARWPFARLSRAEAQRINAKWPRLVGYVHADNAAHVRWLQWCGFSLGQPVTHGVRGDLFHPFERLAHV